MHQRKRKKNGRKKSRGSLEKNSEEKCKRDSKIQKRASLT
jgi:hypothetical protein